MRYSPATERPSPWLTVVQSDVFERQHKVRRKFRAVGAVAVTTAAIFLGSGAYGALGAASAAGNDQVAASPRVVQVNVDFSWDGVRNCESQRPGSVICISAQANVPGLGLVEYARDAVPNGQITPDGCPEFSTLGHLWVPGGTAQFDGAPVATCGGTDNPDAHYSYTIHDGTGVLEGAQGSGDVVADNGKDRWHGTIALAPAPAAVAAAPASASAVSRLASTGSAGPSTGSGGNATLIVVAIVGGLVVLGAALALVVRSRARRLVSD